MARLSCPRNRVRADRLGPPELNARKLEALIDAGFVDPAHSRGGRIETACGRSRLCSDAGRAEIDVVVDAVLPPPGVVGLESPLLNGLIADGHARVRPGRRGIEVGADAICISAEGSESLGLAACGRPTEDSVIGNDTLSRTLHPQLDRWARSRDRARRRRCRGAGGDASAMSLPSAERLRGRCRGVTPAHGPPRAMAGRALWCSPGSAAPSSTARLAAEPDRSRADGAQRRRARGRRAGGRRRICGPSSPARRTRRLRWSTRRSGSASGSTSPASASSRRCSTRGVDPARRGGDRGGQARALCSSSAPHRGATVVARQPG